ALFLHDALPILGLTARHRAAEIVRFVDRAAEPALPHPRVDQNRVTVLRPVPLDRRAPKVGIPAKVNASISLHQLKGLQHVLRVGFPYSAERLIALDGDVVERPVRWLREFVTARCEEHVAEDDAANDWVGIVRPPLVRTVCPHAVEQLLFGVNPVSLSPDRPCLADGHLEVLLEEAAANERVARDVNVAESTGSLRPE